MRHYEILNESLYDDVYLCSGEGLTSLSEYVPVDKKRYKEFIISDNNLTDLTELPKKVRNVHAKNNKLVTLKGGPEIVIEGFDISKNPTLKSLIGGPVRIYGAYDCSNTGITSLEGLPEEVGGTLDISDTKITTLKHIPKKIGNNLFLERMKHLTAWEMRYLFFIQFSGLVWPTGSPQQVVNAVQMFNNFKDLTDDEKQDQITDILEKLKDMTE